MSRLEVLEQMPPFQGGGEMIQDVYLDHSTYAEPPSRFEAGTPGIAEAIGLGVACDYLTDIGMENIHRYEEELGGYLYQQVCNFLHVTHLSFFCWFGHWELQPADLHPKSISCLPCTWTCKLKQRCCPMCCCITFVFQDCLAQQIACS